MSVSDVLEVGNWADEQERCRVGKAEIPQPAVGRGVRLLCPQELGGVPLRARGRRGLGTPDLICGRSSCGPSLCRERTGPSSPGYGSDSRDEVPHSEWRFKGKPLISCCHEPSLCLLP